MTMTLSLLCQRVNDTARALLQHHEHTERQLYLTPVETVQLSHDLATNQPIYLVTLWERPRLPRWSDRGDGRISTIHSCAGEHPIEATREGGLLVRIHVECSCSRPCRGGMV
jgi:hypothetical protein